MKPAAALALLTTTLAGLGAVGAQAAVGGLISNAQTGAPPAADSFVQLTRCSHDGNELCDQAMDFTTASNGKYRFTGSYAPGRYQVNVITDGYLAGNPAPFEIVGKEDHRVDISLDRVPVVHANPSACTAPDASGFCAISYLLKNVSSQPQQLDAWINVATTSPVPAGWSRFAAGDHSARPTLVELAPGAAKTVTQHAYIGRGLPSGAITTLELFVAPHGAPDRTLVYDYFPAVIAREPGTTASSPRQQAADQRKHLQRQPLLRAGRRNQPAGRQTAVVVEVSDATTGEPLAPESAPKFRLMACDQPSDSYCRWIEGDEVDLPASGVMIVDTQGMFPGRYQIQTRAGDNYAYTYSQTFEVPTAGPMKIDMPMKLMPIAVEGVETCEAQPLDACVFKYRLRNTTGETQRASLWLYNNMLSSETSVGSSVYSQGRQGRAGAAPIAFTIPAGETLTVRQPIGLQHVASGSSGWFQLYIADPQDPAYAEGFYRLGNYSVYQEAGQKRVTITPFPFMAR